MDKTHGSTGDKQSSNTESSACCCVDACPKDLNIWCGGFCWAQELLNTVNPTRSMYPDDDQHTDTSPLAPPPAGTAYGTGEGISKRRLSPKESCILGCGCSDAYALEEGDLASLTEKDNGRRKLSWLKVAKNAIMRPIDWYFELLWRCRWFTVVIFAVFFALSVVWAPKLLSVTAIEFAAPKGTLGYDAREAFDSLFEQYGGTQTEIVYVSRNISSPDGVLSEYTENFTYALLNATKYFEMPSWVLDFQSFYTLCDIGLEPIGQGLVASDNHSCLINMVTPVDQNSTSNHFIDYIDDFIRDWPSDPEYTIQRTGQSIITADFLDLMIISDAISISIAIIVLLVMLRSLVLIVIPLVNLAITMATSFALVYLLALAMPVASYNPAIMMAVIVAMSIDYSLFLLRRYREELLNSEDTQEAKRNAVKQMLEHAGRVVLVSGSTLALTFIGLVLLKMGLMTSLGLSAAISLGCTVVVNLALTPSLLLCFPNFFSINGIFPFIASCRKKPSIPTLEEKMETQKKSFWYRIPVILTQTKTGLIALIICLIVLTPIIALVCKFTYTTDATLVFAADLPGMECLNDMMADFPPGVLYPFYFFPVNRINGSAPIFTQQYFDSSQELIRDILDVSNGRVEPTGIRGISYLAGSDVPMWYASGMMDPTNPLYYYDYAPSYRYLTATMMSSTSPPSSALFVVDVNFNPNSKETDIWIADMVDLLEGIKYNGNESSPYSWFFTNVMVDQYFAARGVFDNFPLMVGVTCAVVILLAALSFRSVLLPIRMLFTLGLTVGWVYGFAALVYCIITDTDLYWFPPLIVFSVIVGLGVDYDVFLFSRVTEYRMEGYKTDAAIRNGYYNTGSVITGAGLVMAVAFCGLLISKQKLLQQLGFFLVLAVLLDTFVIRAVVVPPLLHFCKALNWWPSPLPPADKEEFDQYDQKFSTDDLHMDDLATQPTTPSQEGDDGQPTTHKSHHKHHSSSASSS
ncbi:MMPL family transporter [Pelomyxa schiedti]|nr:MMPL family transporter [Pelomyxa schiedti]